MPWSMQLWAISASLSRAEPQRRRRTELGRNAAYSIRSSKPHEIIRTDDSEHHAHRKGKSSPGWIMQNGRRGE